MSNLDKAVKLLGAANLPGRTLHPRQVQAIAVTLKTAGLLAPDLPEPSPYSEEAPSWYEGTFEISISRLFGHCKTGVTFFDSEPGGVAHMDTEAARELAHALLAAANHAEKEQDNE